MLSHGDIGIFIRLNYVIKFLSMVGYNLSHIDDWC